ncbi:hypothetical protein H6P81_008342 [Aristolochia fimbriata]|uniref:FAR1 domain-containing protein n=1 Tax=Aristolochia fimbriata TaxID=158543 RepID=A0AAV7F2Z9_ARIFI|nr:hypothetical protein H6P81_008342 [Aristolochia fimbriata]
MDLPKTPLVEGGSSTSTYVPRGVQDGVLKIGMSFESMKDVEVFYNAYAKEAGFSVSKGSECKKSLTKELYSKLFVCSKQGKPNNGKGILDPVKKRRRGVVRENCEAALRVSKSKDEKWVVVKFIEEHSHILATPRKVPFLPSHREFRPNLDEVVCIRRNDLASKIHKILDVAFKFEEALSFLEKKIDVICDEIGQFEPDCGAKMRVPQEIHVHQPDIAKTKGSRKRLKGAKENAMEQTTKKFRLCLGCDERGEHDKQNCPKLRDMGLISLSDRSTQPDSQVSLMDHYSQGLSE